MKYIISFSALILCLTAATAQNVGIGTTTPLEKLSVVSGFGHGISHEAGGIKLSTYIDANGGWIGTVTNNPFHLYTNNGGAQFTLLQNGNVGIGNINPQFKLDIKGRMKIQTGTIGNIFTTPGIWFDDYRDGSNRVFFGMQDSIRIGIWGEGTPGAGWAFNFNARNGNVGIGVTDPVNKLEVNGDISAVNFKFSNPKTYYYAVPPASFSASRIALGESGDLWVESSTMSPTSTIHSNMNINEFVAPVNLPDGANITSVTYWGIDNSATGNLQFSLRRRLHFGNVYEVLNQASSSGNPGDFTANNPVINFSGIANNDYNYTIYVVCPPGSEGYLTRIKSVRIAYTMTEPD